jgi:hypothetical protein
MIGRIVALAAAGLLVVTVLGVAGAHYIPTTHDGFSYDETVAVSDGYGDYQGYTESTVINGSVTVTGVLPNGTDEAYYYNANTYTNVTGAYQHWLSYGSFTFSPDTFHYVNGTDNQTGYVDPYVWFFIDNSVGPGATVNLLNSAFTVVSTSYTYALDTSAGTNVDSIYIEGNGSYLRDDVYGRFTADYNWQAYFDPGTGYIIGYVYTEQDSNSSGDGFTLTDTLGVTHTSYPLTAVAASSSSSGGGSGWIVLVAILAVVVVVLAVIAALVLRAHRRHPLPTHSATGQVSYTPPPPGPAPPPVHLTPSGQPAVQQIVIKETVKVNCRYCGALIDTTVDKCPFCGATRS